MPTETPVAGAYEPARDDIRHDARESTHHARGARLLALARGAIAARLAAAQAPGQAAPHPDLAAEPWLAEPGAVFVTLTRHGQLRGCIGSLEAWRPLWQDVTENACAAAFRDPRFSPVSAADYPGLRVEVSLLSPAEPLPVADEADAWARLVPGEDGVILSWHSHRATFLPQVWDELPDPQQFLAHLKRKAGLNADFWASDLRLERYRVEKWREGGPETTQSAPESAGQPAPGGAS